MKKVMIVLPNETLGGAEQYLFQVARFFLKHNYEISIFFATARGPINSDWSDLGLSGSVTCYYTHSVSEKKGIVTLSRNLLKVKNTTFEYAFTSHVHITGLVGMLKKLNLLKINNFIGRESTSIFNRYNGLKLFIYKIQYRFGYKSLDLLICQTDTMKRQLVNAIPWLEKNIKIIVLPNPISLDHISTVSTETINDIDIHTDKYIVSAGRLITEKGYDILINVFASISNQYPDHKLLILGEGPKRNELENQITELGLQQKVYLPGFVKNVYPYFRQASQCVVSSRIEGFPNVLLQMMSQNHNVVSTKCAGGIEELEGVITAETDDVDSLEQAMLKSLKSNQDKESMKIFTDILKKRSIESYMDSINENLVKT